MSAALEVLESLRQGNNRFISGKIRDRGTENTSRREELAASQSPSAVVLGCSDSRLPPEVIFDQGLGDLFVVRVAGNVVAPHQLGSIEFAVGQLGARLIVVLGHSGCGAVAATVNELMEPGGDLSPNLRSLVDSIRPSLEPLLIRSPPPPAEALLELGVRANVLASIDRLQQDSESLAQLVRDDELLIVGAEYDLGTGAVVFFEVPASELYEPQSQ